MNKPLVSVIMPVYNAEKYLNKAIDSILNQTLKSFELIAIDDASTDSSYQILKKYQRKDKRIRLYQNKKNLQIARTLNKGVKLAKARYVARMDADDISMKNRLKEQFLLISSDKNLAIVGANMKIIDGKGKIFSKREYPVDDFKLKSLMFRYSPFCHPVVMFRRQVFLNLGGYNVSKVPCEDIDLWFRAGKKYQFATVPKYLIYYRVSYSSNSHKNLKALEILGFKIKIGAIKKLGYKPNFVDYIYNLGQFVSLWFMPPKFRVVFYDFLRSNGYI